VPGFLTWRAKTAIASEYYTM